MTPFSAAQGSTYYVATDGRDDTGNASVHLYFFWSKSCPHCREALPFVLRLDRELDWLFEAYLRQADLPVLRTAYTLCFRREAGAAGRETRGGAGDDTLSGEAGNDRLFGGAGNDLLAGGGSSGTTSYLNGGEGDAFDESACASPLPRAFQWADGSAYVNHVELVRKARGAELPASFWEDPLVYMGASDAFIGSRDDIQVENEDWGIDFEAEVVVITDADGTYPPEHFPDLCRVALAENADLVIGSRMAGSWINATDKKPLLQAEFQLPSDWPYARIEIEDVFEDVRRQNIHRAFKAQYGPEAKLDRHVRRHTRNGQPAKKGMRASARHSVPHRAAPRKARGVV